MRSLRAARRCALALALIACGCAAAPIAGAAGTRYRLGDFVVYHYGGPALAEPVTLREEVTAQEGNRLRIDVTATRKTGTRAWVQLLTDTPENQHDNVVDAVWEKADAGFVKLENAKNRDLYRLYEWTLFMPDKPMHGVTQEPCREGVAGRRLACTCRFGLTTYKGASVRVKESECPDFLWTHGPSDVWPVEGEPVFFVEVVEAGRREDATALPFEP